MLPPDSTCSPTKGIVMRPFIRLVLSIAAAVILQAPAFAQSGQGAEQLNQFLRALQGLQQPRQPTAASADPAPVPSQSARGPYSPEHLQALINGARQARSQRSDLQAYQLCDRAAFDLFPGVEPKKIGLHEMKKECTAQLDRELQEEGERYAAAAEAQRQAKAAKIAAEERAEAEKQEAEESALLADLRSGRRKPQNCPQWAAARGQEPDSFGAPVTRVSLQPPSGVGRFLGRVERIEARTMLLSDQPIIKFHGTPQGYIVINIDKASTIFDGETIRVGTIVAGYATQQSARTIRMTDGSGAQAPVLNVVCIHALN